jgi:hypothetical protein
MSVWVVCPSARPVADVEKWATAWREHGYHVAIMRDSMDLPFGVVDYLRSEPKYPGYAMAVNLLIADVIQTDDSAEWFIAAGDDVFPDPYNTAEDIAASCIEEFGCRFRIRRPDMPTRQACTYGVMQPTGDRWGEHPHHANPKMRSAYIDRVAGSAWIGREFAKRINQGRGPLWPEYTHQFVDQELQEVAIKLGVFWQRRDLIHEHRHWGRQPGGKPGRASDMPDFLAKANTKEHWDTFKALFEKREREGFPGSEPL